MLIYASRPGQLGNCLFYSSHLIFYVVESGDTVYFPMLLDLDYAKYFKGSCVGTIPRYPPRPSLGAASVGRFRRKMIYRGIKAFAKCVGKLRLNNRAFQTLFSCYTKGVVDLARPRNQARLKRSRVNFLVGETFRYMKGSPYDTHRAAVREYFEPLDSIQHRVNDYLGRFAAFDKPMLVGVHVRRGDLRVSAGGRFFYSDEIYLEKMLQFQAEFPRENIQFILFSDDPIDPALFKRSGLEIHQAIGEMVEDLHLMSRCDYLMGPPSTFSCWASYYGSVPLLYIYEPGQRVKREDFAVNPEIRPATFLPESVARTIVASMAAKDADGEGD
jgi:hypothetical protein